MNVVDVCVDEIKHVLFDLISMSKTSKAYNEDDKRAYLSNMEQLINKDYVIKKTIGHFMTKDSEELHAGAIILPLIDKIKQKNISENTSKYTYLKLLEIVISYTSYQTIIHYFFRFIAKYQDDQELNKTLILLLLPYISFFHYVIAIYITVRDKNDDVTQLLEKNREGGSKIKNNEKLMNIAKEFEGLKTYPIDESKMNLFHEKNNRDAISLALADKNREEKISILRQADLKNEYNIVQVLLNDKGVAEKVFRRYLNGIGATKSFPIYVPYVVDGNLSFELTKKKVKIDSKIVVQDITNLSDVDILKYLEEDEDNIVIFILDTKDKVIKNSVMGLTRTELEHALENKDFYYECKNEKSPFRNDLKEDKNPYIKIKRQTINYITAASAHKIVESPSRIFGLKAGKLLPITTSIKSIQVDYGVDFEGDDVDFESADHCQANTDKTSYDVFELDVTWKNKMKGGRKRSKTYTHSHYKKHKNYCKKCKTIHY